MAPALISTPLTGITPRSASGETLTAPAMDSGNTFALCHRIVRVQVGLAIDLDGLIR